MKRNVIKIVNFLLTRKCDLSCNYCSITKNYKGKPIEYPNMRHYIKNEITTAQVYQILSLLKNHNPDVFVIFYGGEPTLRDDLDDIINFSNDIKINYTIISNNSSSSRKRLDKLLKNVLYIRGYTASIDPLVISDGDDKDRVKKSDEQKRDHCCLVV